MAIYGKIVRLRALEPTDMEKLRSYHNDPTVSALLGGWSFPISTRQQERWYESIIGDRNNLRFAVEVPDIGFVGISTLAPIDWKDRRAYHGIIIGEKNLHGKGIGTDVVMTTMRYAFEELQLNRLDGDYLEGNEASARLYRGRCGWVEEGVRRRHAFRQNKWLDRILVGITREEYFDLVARTGYWTKESEA